MILNEEQKGMILGYIAHQADMAPEDISLEHSLYYDLGLSPDLDMFEIICQIEEAFDVNISDEVEDDWITVQDIFDSAEQWQPNE